MRHFHPSPEEQVLAEGPCALRIGPMSLAGHVALTTRRVCFKPSPFSQRLGVEEWSVEIPSIQSAHLVGPQDALSILDTEQRPLLVGLGARIVHERLAPLLTEDKEFAYAPGERVLLHAAATVELSDLLHAVGEVTVTTRRVRFRPNQMDRMLWPRTRFDHDNEQITGFEVAGVRPGVEVRTAVRRTRFVGDVVPALYAALQCNAEVQAGLVPDDAAEPEAWPAMLCRGPVTHPGGLVHSATRLAFVATGLLDSLVGTPSVTEFPLTSITSVSRRGQLDPRIEIRAGDQGMTVSCDDADDCFAQLVTWLVDGAPGPVRLGDGPAANAVEGEIEKILDPWRARFELPAAPRLFTPAVCTTANTAAGPGWLLASGDALTWLPSRAPGTAPAPVTMPFVGARWVWDDDPDEVRVDVDGVPYRWRARSQRTFRLAVFNEVQRARKIRAPAVPGDAEAGNRRDSFRAEVLEQGQPPMRLSMAQGALEVLDAVIVDVSLGGCAARLASDLDLGSALKVELTDGQTVHSARAIVVNKQRACSSNLPPRASTRRSARSG